MCRAVSSSPSSPPSWTDVSGKALRTAFAYCMSHKRDIVLFILAALVFGFVGLYSFHAGFRRTTQFWSGIAPLVGEYKFLKLRKRLDDWREIPEGVHKERLQRFHDRAAPRVTKQMLRMGGIYIKLGQVMSTVGAGFLNPSYLNALQTLQDGVPPRSYAEMTNIIESSTGQKMEDMFEEFDEVPVGAASIGQAHRAVLKGTGESVIVKVQYPEVAHAFKVDFDNMELAVRWIEPGNVDLVDQLRERHGKELDFAVEAGHLREVTANMQRHGVEPHLVRIPRVRNETGICTDNVLVMEYLEGTSLSAAIRQEQDRFAAALGQDDADELKRVLMDRMKEHFENGGGAGEGGLAMLGRNSKLVRAVGPVAAGLFRFYASAKERLHDVGFGLQTARSKVFDALRGGSGDRVKGLQSSTPNRGARRSKAGGGTASNVNLGRVLKTLIHVHGLQLMVDGVFNIDPHPGNVLVLKDGRLGLLDYGMVGRLDERDRLRIAQTVMALARKDKVEAARIYTEGGYRASWKDGKITDPNILHRFASFHFDGIDLSDVTLAPNKDNNKREKMPVMEILKTTREPTVPMWVESGRRLGGLLMGVASQAARPVSLANEWKATAAQVTRAHDNNKKAAQVHRKTQIDSS